MDRADNELLTRVTNGAPMGKWMKQCFWVPAALSVQLVADGAPVRVRLFGDQYVAFRSTDGRVGFFDEACPHRGVSLALARNEDNALRCIFHGWKFDVSGRVVEVPTQVGGDAEICKKVPLKHYRSRESGGIVWVWLGVGDTAPAFPEFEFMKLPIDHLVSYKQTANFNWLQGVETTLDSAHVGFLHRSQVDGMGHISYVVDELAPTYEVEDKAYGFRYAGVRKTAQSAHYVRVNSFVMPWFGVVAPRADYEGGAIFFSVPMDDENCTYWTVRYRVDRPIEKDAVTTFSNAADWPPKVPGGPDTHWGQNRDLMRHGHFTGFPQHITTEDLVICASQGAIVDRTREFLNSGDIAIVRLRRILLREVREFAEGKFQDSSHYNQIPYGEIRAQAMLLPPGADWRNSSQSRP